ncbi:MAG: TonB-dependent receptor [Muribaculum sp.]|nr:TonB-dependent receptor [Muribaculum sp.]
MSPPMAMLAANPAAAAQQVTVKGTVYDQLGDPVIGASVVVLGTTLGASTDLDGNFNLKAPVGSKVRVSYIGYKEQIFTVKAGENDLQITLEENTQVLEEVQVVAYGAQKKVTVTGAISGIQGSELLKTPVASLNNALAGQISGVSSVQYSGEPGADAADIYVRGQATWNDATPLIQVDGVERDFSQIDANEIESITVLKDASATAVFGVRGANGVILITTKRGREGKTNVQFSTSVGINFRTKTLDFANSYEYADYYNMMNINDGGTPTFSAEQLQKFKDHSDPIMYPDIDWIDYCMNKTSLQTQHNVNISGGTERMRYFVSAGMFTQEGMFKKLGSTNDFNFNYNRYNYRANLDFDASKTTLIKLNLGGRVEVKRTPESGEDQNQLFRKLYWAVPFAGAGIVDGKRVVSNTDYLPFTGTDGLSSYYGNGFNQRTTNVLNVDLELQQKLDFLTKGLTFRIKGSYNTSSYTGKHAGSSLPYYTPVYLEDGTIGYRKNGSVSKTSYSYNSQGKSRDWYMEAAFDYQRTFGRHEITALALYNQSKYYYPSSYSDIPSGYVGLVGRIAYNYNTTYMAEFNVGYNGSENFAPNKRYGFFPSGSLGWVVSKEKFFEKLTPYIDYLKVRASLGLVGNDKMGSSRFLYIPDSYGFGDGNYFGHNQYISGAQENTKSNPDVTWEKARKQNYGIDLTILKSRLNMTLDYFREDRWDILSTPDYMPGLLGMSLPVMNVGETENKGFELSLKWTDLIGNGFRYWANFNISYARNKIKYMNEVKQNEEWMQQTGRPIGARSLYKFWGFFDETANERYRAEYGQDIADHGSTLYPGDAVYVDLNGDGTIDGDDASRDLAYTDAPEWTAGLNLGFQWKGFDVTLQFTGAWNVDRALSEFRQPLGDTTNKGLLKYQYDHTWRSSADSGSAKFPRISTVSAANNTKGSTLFLYDASYLRLKSMEIGYTFNFPWMKKIQMQNLRLYCSAYNLFTITDFMWGDPESRQSDRPNYPLIRTFNFGLKVGF